MRQTLLNFLRRLDKSLSKIHKIQRIYVLTDWDAAAEILTGLYETMWKFPHIIVNLPSFKNVVTTCQYLAMGEEPAPDTNFGNYNRKASLPSDKFCNIVFQLISLQVLALGDAWSLEQRLQAVVIIYDGMTRNLSPPLILIVQLYTLD